jgi:hypothetical protein
MAAEPATATVEHPQSKALMERRLRLPLGTYETFDAFSFNL